MVKWERYVRREYHIVYTTYVSQYMQHFPFVMFHNAKNMSVIGDVLYVNNTLISHHIGNKEKFTLSPLPWLMCHSHHCMYYETEVVNLYRKISRETAF